MPAPLVLSTLHTNDAPATITRLIDLGVPRYLVAAHAAGVLAQRLVRALCPACRTRPPPLLPRAPPRPRAAAPAAGVLAPRLGRALSRACRTRGRPPLAHALQLALPAATGDDSAWWLPAGCPARRGAGYQGRISLFETLIPTPPIPQ